MTKLTRSVHFAATSHIILFPKDDLIDNSRSWYLEDKARFRREMIQQAHQLRTAIRLGSVHPQDFSEDVLINCTGIETLVLFSESMLRRIQEMKRSHIHCILAAQRHLNASGLSLLSRRSSENAQQMAYAVAMLQT
eukprot:scaffold17053_cov75-Skeletonema_dohrnii-CCMP3373.AAC.3